MQFARRAMDAGYCRIQIHIRYTEVHMNIMENKGKLHGILMLAVGIILLVWPTTSLLTFCRLLGACLVISGAVEIILGLAGNADILNTAGGAVSLIVGLLFVMRPWLVISFLPRLVGLCLVIIGALFLLKTLIRREKGTRALFYIAGGAVAVIIGLILMFNWHSTVKLLMVVLGIVLIYFGILRIGRS